MNLKIKIGLTSGVAALLLPLLMWAFTYLPAGSGEKKITVSIAAGSGAGRIADELENSGVIRSSLLFKISAISSGKHASLKAGEYAIPGNLNQWEVLEVLVSGKALLHKFLVPEGLSRKQMAALLQEKQLAQAGRFLDLSSNTVFAKSLGYSVKNLEGYLFPDSYQFSRGIAEEKIITMMIERFKEMVPDTLLKKGRRYGLNPHQVLTLASVIEKECSKDEERAKVASVFYNRMAQNKRLESCATIRFAMDKFTGPILWDDLYFKSRYNTYRRRGLPPGPICSPGIKSIEAAVNPADTKYLFFVVAGDGVHLFSETFEEHKKAKFRYKRLQKRGVVQE